MKKKFLFYFLIIFSVFLFSKDPITINLPPGQVYVGMNVQFSVQNPDNAKIYKWNFGDGSPVQQGNPIMHSFKEPKSYQIKCFTDPPPGPPGEGIKTLVVNDNRNIQVQGGPFISGTEVDLNTNNFVENNVKWDFGDGTPQQNGGKSIKHTFQNPGTYTVKAFDFGGNTLTAITASVPIIADNRTITVTPVTALKGQTVKFVANNFTTNSLKWDFGNGIKNGGVTISNKYTSPGSFTIKVTDLSDSSLGEVKVNITVQPDNRNIRMNRTNPYLYQPINFVFENSFSPTIEWDFGDGKKMNGGKNITHFYSTKGQFKVIATELGVDRPKLEKMVAINTDSREIQINPHRIQVGNFVELRLKNSTVTVLDWQIGMETKRNAPNMIRYQFIDPGNFDIICNINGQTPLRKRITVFENRKIDIRIKYLFENANIEFYPVKFKGASYRWDFGDGTIKTGRGKMVHKFRRPGNYVVKVFDFDGKSKVPVIARIRVIPDNRKILSVYENFYAGAKAKLKTVGFIENNVKWNFGDGTTLVGSSVTEHLYRSPGVYTIKAIDMGGRGSKEIIKKIIVKRDTRDILLPQKIIEGVPVKVGLKGYVAGNYEWKFDDGSIDQGVSIASKIFKRAGLIKVTLLDKLKKDPPLVKMITVVPDRRLLKLSSEVVLPKKKVICTAVEFLGNQVKWDFGDGETKITNSKSVSHSYSKTGNFKVIASDFGGNGKKLFQKNISVSNILPGFKIQTLEFKFSDGKYYKIAQKNQYKLDYNLRVKAMGSGILFGKILVNDTTLGLFEIYLDGGKVGYLKRSAKPKLPLIDLGMHELSFEFTNFNYSGQKPVLKYFVTIGKSIFLKYPKDNSTLSLLKPVKFVWTNPYKHLEYEYAFSVIPFQFLKDNQVDWTKPKSKNSVSIDLQKLSKAKYGYLIIHAKDKNGTVKTVSQIYSFKIK